MTLQETTVLWSPLQIPSAATYVSLDIFKTFIACLCCSNEIMCHSLPTAILLAFLIFTGLAFVSAIGKTVLRYKNTICSYVIIIFKKTIHSVSIHSKKHRQLLCLF